MTWRRFLKSLIAMIVFWLVVGPLLIWHMERERKRVEMCTSAGAYYITTNRNEVILCQMPDGTYFIWSTP